MCEECLEQGWIIVDISNGITIECPVCNTDQEERE